MDIFDTLTDPNVRPWILAIAAVGLPILAYWLSGDFARDPGAATKMIYTVIAVPVALGYVAAGSLLAGHTLGTGWVWLRQFVLAAYILATTIIPIARWQYVRLRTDHM